jgi:hypothetical protein
MAFEYPERLLPSSEKLKRFVLCDECFLCRRSIEKSKMLDEDGIIEVAAIEAERLLDYSVNLVNCGLHSNSEIIFAQDVLIEVDQLDYTKAEFDGDDSSVPSSSDITGRIALEKGYFLIAFRSIGKIKTTFPFRKDKKGEREFRLELRAIHKPNLINISHFEFECWSDFAGEFSRVSAAKIKEGTYREKITHIVRDSILNLRSPELQIINN